MDGNRDEWRSQEKNNGSQTETFQNIKVKEELIEDISSEINYGLAFGNYSNEVIIKSEKKPVLCTYRVDSDSDSSDSSSSVSSLSVSSLSDVETVQSNATKQRPLSTKGELLLDDLPLIEELKISVPQEDIRKVGFVSGIVEQLVVVQTLSDCPPLNFDSVLFLSGNKPLGQVFDVFGKVSEPYYTVRFNNAEEIKERGIKIGNEVYYAPTHEDITSYIFVDGLRKEKGSDASWKDNNEPPIEFLDYSDDEQERNARLRQKGKRKRCSSSRSEQSVSNYCTSTSLRNNYFTNVQERPPLPRTPQPYFNPSYSPWSRRPPPIHPSNQVRPQRHVFPNLFYENTNNFSMSMTQQRLPLPSYNSPRPVSRTFNNSAPEPPPLYLNAQSSQPSFSGLALMSPNEFPPFNIFEPPPPPPSPPPFC